MPKRLGDQVAVVLVQDGPVGPSAAGYCCAVLGGNEVWVTHSGEIDPELGEVVALELRLAGGDRCRVEVRDLVISVAAARVGARNRAERRAADTGSDSDQA